MEVFRSTVIFFRKYVEPEPQWGVPGKEESCVEWVLADQGGKLTLNELIRFTKMTPADLDVMLRDLELSGKIIREGRRISLKKQEETTFSYLFEV